MFRGTRPAMAVRPARQLIISSSSVMPWTKTSSLMTLRSLSSQSRTPKAPARVLSRPFLPVARIQQPQIRYVTKSPQGIPAGRDSEEEAKFRAQKMESHPEEVTTDSSVRHFWEPQQGKDDPDLKKGIKDELETVKDTFALSTVPKESYFLGLAGTIPYLFTSVSTVYLSWDLNTTWPSGSSFADSIMISHEAARSWLGILEPLQLGYGAIIISFLGAIHWGLEYAERKPDLARTRFRYGLGVLAPIVAWPSLLMPVPFALTTQFAAFVGLYFADTRAVVRGWAPSWYGAYRFVLTAVVGVAIVISLIGRAKVGDAQPRLSGLDQKLLHPSNAEQPYNEKWAKREAEDKARMQKEAERAEKKHKAEEKKAAQEEKKKSQGKGEQKAAEGEKQEDVKKDEGKSDGKKNEEKSEENKGEEKKGEEKKDNEEKQGDEEKSDEKKGEEESSDEKKDGEKSEEKKNDKKDDDKEAADGKKEGDDAKEKKE